MKNVRQKKILNLIDNKLIETQEDLGNELRKENFNVTQATISRDIKELGLIKIQTGNKYRYAPPSKPNKDYNYTRMVRLFKDSVLKMNYSENLILIKTIEGTANALAFCIDKTDWDEIIGTIAGDDTILVIIKPIEKVEYVLEKFNDFL